MVCKEETNCTIAKSTTPASSATATATATAIKSKVANPHDALVIAHTMLDGLPGIAKIGTQDRTHTLLLRFHFPDLAQQHYAEQLATLAEKTGWQIRIHPSVHQQAMIEAAQRAVPASFVLLETPSLNQSGKIVKVVVMGEEDQAQMQEAWQRFHEETGWQLAFEFRE